MAAPCHSLLARGAFGDLAWRGNEALQANQTAGSISGK